jgi:hypothetical protein
MRASSSSPLRVVTDVFERASRVPAALTRLDVDVIVEPLSAGDYRISDDILVERKTVPDLHGSLGRNRLWAQLGRLRDTARSRRRITTPKRDPWRPPRRRRLRHRPPLEPRPRRHGNVAPPPRAPPHPPNRRNAPVGNRTADRSNGVPLRPTTRRPRGGYRDPESQAFIESWFGKLKEREVWLNEYETLEDAIEGIGGYVDRYHHRPHSGLNYRTPTEVRQTWENPELQKTAA